jgi:hypothetical protein
MARTSPLKFVILYELSDVLLTVLQVAREDANQEVIALIRTRVDAFDTDQAAQNRAHEDNTGTGTMKDNEDTEPEASGCDDVQLKSPATSLTNSKALERTEAHRAVFDDFHHILSQFIKRWLPDEAALLGDAPVKVNVDETLFLDPHTKHVVQIRLCTSLHVRFQSLEDFREQRDILHCSPLFHGRPRYDSVCLNTTDAQFGRLEALLRCYLPSGRVQDLVFVQAMKKSKWRPPTFWDGCTVVEKARGMLLMPQYVLRGE